MDERTGFAQTFVGAIMAAVFSGIILLVIQKTFERSENSIPSVLRPHPDLVPGRHGASITQNSITTFVAPIGVTPIQIEECVERNSTQFMLGKHYSFEQGTDSFGEVVVKIHDQNQLLNDLLRVCSKPRVK